MLLLLSSENMFRPKIVLFYTMFKVFSFLYLHELILWCFLVYFLSALACECWFMYNLLSMASFSYDFQTIFKERQGRPPSSLLVARQWVQMNMHQYHWISLNILENAWINCSDYAKALNMPDHLTCSTSFWRYFGL